MASARCQRCGPQRRSIEWLCCWPAKYRMAVLPGHTNKTNQAMKPEARLEAKGVGQLILHHHHRSRAFFLCSVDQCSVPRVHTLAREGRARGFFQEPGNPQQIGTYCSCHRRSISFSPCRMMVVRCLVFLFPAAVGTVDSGWVSMQRRMRRWNT
ncbi:hypothetical protein BZA05DRAFT_398434 [Tricharina praecox]|uniref:uncharacterized protein n=1 Tax=Tricharina praecox TaxID=43433 RepID=UPI0022206208|nr:uncharacterized protein BZA05DRAFT_398434 [Tricharina praecox]KAI5851953.1 hypothetical protein BZA05DRAFT_398434 [Tricharina praecox]